MFKYGVPDHSALVFLQAPKLNTHLYSLLERRAKVVQFREPYWGDKLTAIAIEPTEDENILESIQELELAS